MKVLISLFIWFAGSLFFVFFLFFAIVCSYIFPERIYDPWLKALMRFLFALCFTSVKVEGLENIEAGKTYLYMANHVSLFDPPLLGGYIPGLVRGVEAKQQHGWPLYGHMARRLGNVPIDRESIQNSLSSYKKTLQLLNSGRSMIILPEGHRTLDGKMRPFKTLPFRLAKQMNKSIIPVGISGMYHLKRKGDWKILPSKVKIRFGKEISEEVIQSLSITELKELMQIEIGKLIERP
ncbi:MAG: 1-acyl-sn-glycerol-3-phosphate acyltransferase [Bacteroidales bacterium]|nr:1-acyl-sn-glycerol-3-phosphate acyltransferase [Bacteroidales bacterium]MCB9014042.1 1-acyl-sn-glycerol-3-phosphate acyltransferase [Bacteroidales bacterium]